MHPCPIERKLSLVGEIILRNPQLNIAIVSSESNDMLKENIIADNVSILSDKELITNNELFCDFLISYDLPESSAVYMARVSKATQKAVILADENEEKKLYKIETLLGRAIKREIVDGYEPKVEEKVTFEKPKKDFKKDFKKEFKKDFKKEKSKAPYKADKKKKEGKKITIKSLKSPK